MKHSLRKWTVLATFIIVEIILLLQSLSALAQDNKQEMERSVISDTEELNLHTSASLDDVLKLLGPPTSQVDGYPSTYGDAQDQLKKMGIQTLLYPAKGIRVNLRNGKVFGVTVTKPFKKRFHGFQLGTHFSKVLEKRGNPDQTYFGPNAERRTYKKGEIWKWRITESQAGYYIGNNDEHVVVYDLNFETGIIESISEHDDRIKGKFYLIPSFK